MYLFIFFFLVLELEIWLFVLWCWFTWPEELSKIKIQSRWFQGTLQIETGKQAHTEWIEVQFLMEMLLCEFSYSVQYDN